MSAHNKTKLEVGGWLVFIASALMYGTSGLRAGDWFSTAGSLLFLIACFFFLIPFAGNSSNSKSSRSREAIH